MDTWKVIALILAVLILKGDAACILESKQVLNEECIMYIHCTDTIDRIHLIWEHNDCLERHRTSYIFLSIDNISLDLLWNLECNSLNDRIKMITLTHVNKIPVSVNKFENLEQISVKNSQTPNVNLNTFNRFQHLKNINVSYNNINLLDEFSSTDLFYPAGNGIENIDLSHNFIRDIPNSVFFYFSELKYLNLSHNSIKMLQPGCFVNMNSLQSLDMSYNKLIELGHTFANIINVREINLNNNNLTLITEPSFIALANLEKLNLSSNNLKYIEDEAFRSLSKLKEIDLSNNKLIQINKVLFWSNTELYRVMLANNKIRTIESDAFKGKNVTIFDIRGNNLSKSLQSNSFKGIATEYLNLNDEEIFALDAYAFADLNTSVLNLSNNILTTVDAKAFQGIRLVSHLDVSYNNLSRIDFETGDMWQLLTLNASKNQISYVSETSLRNFVTLTKLDLSFNKISTLEPQLFSKLKKLEFLDVSNNFLAGSLKENYFLGLSAVTDIRLERNRFTTIENEAFNGLTSLKFLNCASGELTNIQYEAFKNTSSLETIDLSNNLLENLIVNLTSISSVKELNLNDNEIHNVTAKSISSLSHLEKLYVANNNIIILESKLFGDLNYLKFLDLSNNPNININDVFTNITFLTELKLGKIKKRFNFKQCNNISIARLDLSNNNIENINNVFIFKINDLEYLDLHGNKIAVIDKNSFENMPSLIWLDLSSNLISVIQPGTFLHANAIKTLNLYDNALPSLQYGVLNGLYDLETLNLSNNAIHEFRNTLLHDTPKVSTVALDNNVIVNIKFEDFLASKIKRITIGGNPISCHTIAEYTKRHIIDISADPLDYHNENFHGISCISTSNDSTNISWNQNSTFLNGTGSFWTMSKAIENSRVSLDKIQTSIDKIYSKIDPEGNKNTQKNMINILKAINVSQNNTNAYLKELTDKLSNKSINEYMNATKISEEDNMNFKSTNAVVDHYLEEKLKLLSKEKDKMVEEMHEFFENLKYSQNFNSGIMKAEPDDKYESLKSALYFVGVCLVILILFSVTKFSCKYFKSRKQFQKSFARNSSQQANIMELQEN